MTLLLPVISPEQKQSLVKSFDDLHSEMTDQMLNDAGQGSIFKNILQINEYCSTKLQAKIDLSSRDCLESGGLSDTLKRQNTKF